MIKQCCVPLTTDTSAALIALTGEEHLKDALTVAVEFTLKHYRKKEKKKLENNDLFGISTARI